MIEGARVGVVVPARNEAPRLPKVLGTLPSWIDWVMVVDDGSLDETAAIAERLGAQVVRHPESRGVGAAIITGYRAALDAGLDVVVVMAGDGQMCPRDLPALVLPVVRSECDYAKGDRFHHPDIHIMPFFRRRVGGILSRLTGLAIGVPNLSDSQSGYTAISRVALEGLSFGEIWTRYGYPNDLLGHLVRAGFRTQDVVVRPVYDGEPSGLRAWHVIKILEIIARAGALRVLEWPPPVRPSRDAPMRASDLG